MQLGMLFRPKECSPKGKKEKERSARFSLEELFEESRLYTSSKNYHELLQFVARLPHLAPFNAMLLQVQKPGLKFAASAHDWRVRFGRTPKPDARPLLVMWPFGPVALVYDELDTEGNPLPRDVRSHFACGAVDAARIEDFRVLMNAKSIHSQMIDVGDLSAGHIRVLKRTEKATEYTHYGISINRNHTPCVQFVTIAHELGHLFLGHLGGDPKLAVPERRDKPHQQVELEAESVAYLICKRNGVVSASETYLQNYVDQNTTIEAIDVCQVMQAAGQVESILHLGQRSTFGSRV
jgi:hypothetical protein